ncbi:hypothetical protein [Flavobacterium sp.]|uniref:hypothetical protein n=1 Tax=Flavobacterium sp. TaxID=239 RepID=UPI002B4AE50C|nr:hypothetical protein [Flavobacterium sp.]HLP63139.1 hypothetical protein [Flavobacterium sp.]
MKTLSFKKIVFFITLISINIYAQSPETSKIKTKILQQLKFSRNDIKDNLYVEKVLSNNNKLSVVVVPKISRKEVDEFSNEILSEMDAYILLVENSNGNIISTFYESNAWVSDAISISSIEINTELYSLNSNVNAFGIQVNYEGSSRANPYDKSDLSLFVKDGDNLKRVLNSFSIKEYKGEWDTNCEGQFEYVESVITIDEKMTHNFSNLIVKQTFSKFRNELIKDDCIEKITKEKTKTKKLKYNGMEYK